MTLRLPYSELSPEAYRGLIQCKMAIEQGSLGKSLIELVYLRISQMNGCAFCLEMHSHSLRKSGVSNQKIDTVAGWRVSHHFDERERAVLAWTESLVHIQESGAPDELFEALKKHFNDQEISDLSMAISLMSAFNRLAIGLRQ